jgi:hypothetical protein
MIRTILVFGVIAGLIVAVPMVASALIGGQAMTYSQNELVGYLVMVIALSTIFLAVKHYRDRQLGGVIKFVPAFLMGLAISAVAGIFFVAGWEIHLSITGYDFMQDYLDASLEKMKAQRTSGSELDAYSGQMNMMRELYLNPLFRLPVTFIEIFPVGVLVSLVSALLLRNSQFLPARSGPAAT